MSSTYNRRDFLRLFAGAAAGAALSPLASLADAAQQRKPNIIFILADDLGWGDLGCYGHPQIKTPNLDKLAAQGMLFTQFYAGAPVCSPSRAAFMTGQYPAKLRIHHALSNPLSEDLVRAGTAPFLDPKNLTIARALKSAGYATGHVGKWHLGAGSKSPEVDEYGFDFFKVANGSPPAWREAVERKTDPYWRARSTGLFVDESIKFIEQNRDKPFYLNLWTLAPHATLNPTPEQMAPYSSLGPGDAAPYPGAMAIYYGTVTDVDAQIGRLLSKLDEMGLTENTIVIFSSDNGPEDIHTSGTSHSGVGSPGPFRGRKRSLYDGGTRMPFIVRWPGVVPKGRVNKTAVVSAVDLLPTLCAAAGVRQTSPSLDGEDVTGILRGSAGQRRGPIFWDWRFGQVGDSINDSPQLAVREGQWKLLMNRDSSRVELYDFSRGTLEVDNVASEHPDVVKRLSQKLLAWQKTLPPGEYSPIPSHGADPLKREAQSDAGGGE